jgi:hypothetical protein
MKRYCIACVLLSSMAAALACLFCTFSENADLGNVAVAADRTVTRVLATASVLNAADGYGTITGQFVLDGATPELAPKVKKGDAGVKDAAVCAVDAVPDEGLVVDSASKGIANVFIYMKKAPAKIHPDLKTSKEKEVVFDQKGCRFLPHALLVRTDQVVKVLSQDAVAHNTQTNPLRNSPINLAIPINERKGVLYKNTKPELLPTKVNCSYHAWMTAYWLILDHPYAAVTGPDGKFTIEKVPAGTHEFVTWQESAGYIERKLNVTVKDGETTDLGVIKVPVGKFQGK